MLIILGIKVEMYVQGINIGLRCVYKTHEFLRVLLLHNSLTIFIIITCYVFLKLKVLFKLLEFLP